MSDLSEDVWWAINLNIDASRLYESRGGEIILTGILQRRQRKQLL